MLNLEEGVTTPIHEGLVTLVLRFWSCLEALMNIFEAEPLPVIAGRLSEPSVLIYRCMDISGSGFGRTQWIDDVIIYLIGTWKNQEG